MALALNSGAIRIWIFKNQLER